MKDKILIAIDDGHGKETAGKRSPAFSDGRILKENDFNERTAEFLQAALERHGFGTLLVAPEDTDTPLKTRVQRANDANADIYISIHANAYGTEWNGANGIETWIYEKVGCGEAVGGNAVSSTGDSETYRLARCVQDALTAETGRKSRGIKRSGDLYVLNSTRMHAVLVECGFMTNKEEAELLCSEDYRRKCAEALCRGICEFYRKEYREEETKMPEEKRYQTMEELPSWARPLMEEMDIYDCIADTEHMNLSWDMLRVMVLLDRLWTKKQA
ncbi:N-acetylmuramoyl-L-alanine amidase [Anaerotignum sp.]